MTVISSNKIAPLSEAEAFFAANPDIDAIDIIFTNLGGVPRGKRLRQHEVIAVYKSGRFLPGSLLVVDITGARLRGDRAGLGRRRCRSLCAARARHAGARAVAGRTLRPVPDQLLRARPYPQRSRPAPCAGPGGRCACGRGADPGGGGRARILPRRSRERPPGSGARHGHRPPLHRHPGLWPSRNGRPPAVLRRALRRPAMLRTFRSKAGSANMPPASSNSPCATRPMRCAPPTMRSCTSAWSRAWRSSTGWRRPSWPSRSPELRAAACTSTSR